MLIITLTFLSQKNLLFSIKYSFKNALLTKDNVAYCIFFSIKDKEYSLFFIETLNIIIAHCTLRNPIKKSILKMYSPKWTIRENFKIEFPL